MFAKQKQLRRIILLLFLPLLLWGQGTYYNGIDTGSASFVTDLHNLIYHHTKISYDQFDETNVAAFASRDTTGGQNVVTCVYSGQNYVYSGTFAWGTFSREHTWCHSWMPTYDSETGPEYSDQHHLFPTNQNNANGRRSNHPLGEVASISYQYLEGKLGTNDLGQTVYEPRESHKGDAARALLYMSICYNGENGMNWTFDYLNTETLPGLASAEAAQDVDLLLQWHNQDPPDDWERARNDYIYSIQGNRNPFVDHPEYANVIDFNTLTKKTSSPTTPADEPTNYPSGFDATVVTSSSVTASWTDPSGAVLPTGYLLAANTAGTFADPSDGTTYSDDTNLADGSARVNVAYGTETHQFTGLSSSTVYYFKLYPYNGSGSSRNYKTASFPPELSAQCTTSAGSSGSYISITSPTFSYSQNFDALSNTGSSNPWTDNTTIQGWYSSRTLYMAGNGGSNTGALYSYGTDAATDRALGSAASGSTGTLFYAVRFRNNSGGTITSIPVSFTGEQWRNGGNTAAQSLTFEYKINAASIGDAAGWNAVASLNFTGPVATASMTALDGNNSANKATLSTTIPLTLPEGEEIWFRWTDINDGGNDHGLSIDDFSFNPLGASLPVELTSFSASIVAAAVLLRWETATEVNNHGFEIERKSISDRTVPNPASESPNRDWTRIGFAAGKGTSSAPAEYSFTDRIGQSGKYAYRLKQIDRDGRSAYSHTVEVTAVSAPAMFSLEQNYPNPFNPETHIRFSLAAPGFTTLTVHNAIGQEIAVLKSAFMEAGSYGVPFDASRLSGGIYFYTLRSGGYGATKKFLLLK